MRVLRLHDKGIFCLHEEPVPAPGPGEVLLGVTAVGLCGSDVHWYMEGGIGDAVLKCPLVLGHEFVGRIESGPRAGERVVVEPAMPCGHCALCLAGQQHLCPETRFAGHDATDGALREFIAWPEELTYPLPGSIPDAEATLLEPLGVALHALDLGHVGPGSAVAVCGCGPIGLLLIQLLHMAGATTVLATDPLPHRIEAAEALGATLAWQTRESAVEPGIVKRLPGGGVDVTFEAAGDNAAVEQAVDLVRPGGRVVLVGIPADDRTSFTASTARRKGLTILLSRRMRPGDLPRALHLAEAGRIALVPLVSERYPLSEWRAAFEAAASRRGLKVIVEPQSSEGARGGGS